MDGALDRLLGALADAVSRPDPLTAVCRAFTAASGSAGTGMLLVGADGVAVSCLADTSVAAAAVELELVLGEGPCHRAVRIGEELVVGDLVGSTEFAVYAVGALPRSVRSVAAFPLLVGRVTVGAVAVVGTLPGGLSVARLGVLRAAVGAAGVLVAAAGTSPATAPVVDDEMFTYAAVVHQAAGRVAEQLRCTPREAMDRLRAAAVARSLPLDALAREVVEGTTSMEP